MIEVRGRTDQSQGSLKSKDQSTLKQDDGENENKDDDDEDDDDNGTVR